MLNTLSVSMTFLNPAPRNQWVTGSGRPVDLQGMTGDERTTALSCKLPVRTLGETAGKRQQQCVKKLFVRNNSGAKF